MHWGELDRDTERELIQLASDLLKAESGTGRPPRCAACYYWRAWQTIEDSLKSGGSGECRRHAPPPEIGFAITRADDWCGDGSRLTVRDLAQRIRDERRKQPERESVK
jgi:hypothetical protein